jgi:hypothetical protein
MHLERVTTRSSEAGVAGWIASNDVTLFTMVLVMVIAIFMHSRVNFGLREQQRLADEKTAVTATLASTASELDDARDLLDRTSDSLSLTQQERDQLQQQLVEKLAALAELNARLELLTAEKGELARQRESLVSEKDALAAQKRAVESDLRSETSASATLRTRLDVLTTQLAAKVAALEEIEQQRDELKRQAAELKSIVAALKARVEEMNLDLAAAKSAADASAADLEAQVDAGQQRADATEMLESLKLEKQRLEGQLNESERRRQAQLLAEAENNRELIGLKGPLRKVAILFDASGSMRQRDAGGGDRWSEAQEIAATWMKHLNVQECVVIVFSTEVRAIPDDGTLADLRGDAGPARREQLLRQLQSVEPGGWTDTLAAFQKAYEYDVDTILLLSDGAPSKVATGAFQESLAQEIYALCREHADIPVNAIGLGNYFDQEMSMFLRTVANLTGGSFRGE